MINGAIPIVDVPPDDNQWSWISSLNSSQVPAGRTHPLGWVFPSLTKSRSDLWTLRSKQIEEWPAFMIDGDASKWKQLSKIVDNMGEVEITQRKHLNMQWYISEIQDLRQLIQIALFNDIISQMASRDVFAQKISDSKNTALNFSRMTAGSWDDACGDVQQCFSVHVYDGKELERAVKQAVALSSKISGHYGVIIVLRSDYYEVENVLNVKGVNLHMALKGRPRNLSSLASNTSSRLNQSLSLIPTSISTCVLNQCILDGKHSTRVILLHQGASLYLDNVVVFRGSYNGQGGGVKVMGQGTKLQAGVTSLMNSQESLSSLKQYCIGSISFIQNEAGVFGGGALFVGKQAKVVFGLNSAGGGALFYGNIANSVGGAMNVEDMTTTVELASPLFFDNSAFRGGAVGANSHSIVLLNHASFRNNIAYFDGGGVYVNSALVKLDGVTFYNNSVSMGGSALHVINKFASVTLGNSLPPTFYLNRATYGHLIGLNQGASLSLTLWKQPKGESTGSLVEEDAGIWGRFVLAGDLVRNPLFCKELNGHWSLIQENEHVAEFILR